MPCYDGRENRDDEERKERLDAATRAACDAAAVLARGGSWGDLRADTLEWMTAHAKLDASRIARERETAQREQVRRDALAKLSTEERHALGLRD
jgi:hypothetical protein